jgi:hypothetical protein
MTGEGTFTQATSMVGRCRERRWEQAPVGTHLPTGMGLRRGSTAGAGAPWSGEGMELRCGMTAGAGVSQRVVV